MSRVRIELSPASADPPFEQIRSQITALVLAGELVPGDRLPPIRQLAGDLGLASGTVARAYRELERDGVVRGHGARGTAVVGAPTASRPLHDDATAYAEAARRVGLGFDDAVTALRIAFAVRREP